ncbi:MAG: hypothetical protein M3O46_07415 [Myxococcota bacterium]|nr:hypothetical protein [Myxococcota bacterium]
MTNCTSRLVARASLGVAVAICATSGSAFAEDSAQGEPSFKPTPSTAPSATDTSNQLLGPIERLPASAYPSSPIRGIYGGSLWRTFHGMQWPYYPKPGIGVSGYVWLDSGYEHIARGGQNDPSNKFMVQQGRFVLRATPTWSDGHWFVQGQAELVANEDQSRAPPLQADVDDLWIKVGRWGAFDLQVGRYEAWEIYHRGMGLDRYTLEEQGVSEENGNGLFQQPQLYGVTFAMYRPQSAGAAAIHVYPTQWLRFEAGGQYGNETGQNTWAVRPVAIVDGGWLKFKVGGEYQDRTDQKDGSPGELKQRGAGAALQFVVDPWVEFGVNGAYGLVDFTSQQGREDPAKTYSIYSTGAFANVRPGLENLLLGAGVNYSFKVDKQFDSALGRNQDFDQWQVFGAAQYVLWKQLFVKGVFGYALANFNPNMMNISFKDEMLSGRLRLEYLF